jgi:hypothetical protein
MPHWNDLTPDQCADVRVIRDVVADGARRPLDGVGVAALRELFGTPAEDPMYDGWEVGAAQLEAVRALAGSDVEVGAVVEATGVWAARLALEGPAGYVFLELLDHRRIGVPSDGTVLIEVNLSLFGPYVCVLPWFSAPAGALGGFCAGLGEGSATLALDGLELRVADGAFSGRVSWPEWADVRFGPVRFDAVSGAEEFRAVLGELS